MKKLYEIVTLLMILSSCTVLTRTNKDLFKITVLDKENNSPIDNAMVILATIVDARDVYLDTIYTNKQGKCKFKVNYPDPAQYQVRTVKDGLLGYYEKGYADLTRASSVINAETGNNITLYLTSDLLNHYNFWNSRLIRYETDTLIHILKANRYPLRSEFPLLLWQDIPALLAIGNSRTVIDKYPISVVSSISQEDCYLGIVSLWFVESIRITEMNKTIIPSEKFPSLNPLLHYEGTTNRDQSTNSIEIMEKAYLEYLTWWNEVKNMEKDSASKINPLANINIKW